MATILFGGSFDPIHNGHFSMAKTALDFLPQAELLLIPAACSPFKTQSKAADPTHRLAMCRLAADNHPRMQVTDVEFHLETPSYTVRTVEALQKAKQDSYYFLCGADSFLSLQRWKEYEKLIGLVTFLAVNRDDSRPHEMTAQKEQIEADGGKVILLNMPKVAVSSTQIRNAIRLGQPLTDLVPPLVAQYIQENNLYKE